MTARSPSSARSTRGRPRHRRLRPGAGGARRAPGTAAGAAARAERPRRSRQPLAVALRHLPLAVGYQETIGSAKCPCWITGVPVRAAFFEVPARAAAPRHAAPAGARWQPGSEAGQHGDAGGGGAARCALPVDPDHPSGRRAQPGGGANGLCAGRCRRPLTSRSCRSSTTSPAPWRRAISVSRAGAITLAEICAAGRASLLVPLAISKGHQVENARLLAEAGAAEMIPSNRAVGRLLAARLEALLSDGGRPAAHGRAARSLARPRAAADIADRVNKLGRRKAGGRR